MTDLSRNPQGSLKLLKTDIRGNNPKKELKRLVLLFGLLASLNALAGAQVTPVNETIKIKGNGCEVTVYQTQLSALKNGEIEEICLIQGTSSGQVRQTSEKAIRNNAHAACGCGTDKLYVMSRSSPDSTSAHVVMVAFRYLAEKNTDLEEVNPYEAIKAKKSSASGTRNFRSASSGTSTGSSTKKVFLRDYDRLPHVVTQPISTKMIWLGKKDSSD